MMSMLKRVLSITLVLVLVACTLPMAALAAQPASAEGTTGRLLPAGSPVPPAETEAPTEPAVTETTEPAAAGTTEATEETEPSCTCKAEEGQPHGSDCPLYEAPVETEPTCTCKAEEGKPHTEDCPLYEAPAETEPAELDVAIEVENLSEGEIYFGSNIRLIANVSNVAEDTALTYQWFYSLDGEDWKTIQDANSKNYDFTLDETNNQYYWKVDVSF